ncbi:hypothetical protein F180042I2_08100 [Enterocloster bolteae]
MKKIGVAIFWLLIGIFTTVTGIWISKNWEQKIFLIIIGVFFIIVAISHFFNNKQK